MKIQRDNYGRVPYADALTIAETVVAQLAPHCERIQIAGSIRRKRRTVKDIEIVCIPKPYETGLFQSGIAEVIEQWECVKGQLQYGVTKYTQRMHPSGIAIDIFFAVPENWGYILGIRTGPWDYSKQVLAAGWVKNGYRGVEGILHYKGRPVEVREERELFQRCGVSYCEPEQRQVNVN